MKKEHRSQITKNQILKTKTSREYISMANHRRGKQHQWQLNSDPTQRDVVSNLSQNRKKKKTNIDWNNIQRRKKQSHNIELICLIYNKYQIISQKKKVRKTRSRRWVFSQWWWEALHTGEVNEIHRWWRLKVKIWRKV